MVVRIAWILLGVALTLGALKGGDLYTQHQVKQTAMTYMQAVIDNDTKTLREVTTPEFLAGSQTRGWVSAFRTLVGAKTPTLVGVTKVTLQEDSTAHVYVKLNYGDGTRTEGCVIRKDAEGTYRVSGKVR